MFFRVTFLYETSFYCFCCLWKFYCQIDKDICEISYNLRLVWRIFWVLLQRIIIVWAIIASHAHWQHWLCYLDSTGATTAQFSRRTAIFQFSFCRALFFNIFLSAFIFYILSASFLSSFYLISINPLCGCLKFWPSWKVLTSLKVVKSVN